VIVGPTSTGTPQGGILSPLLTDIALSVLDEHFAAKWAALDPEWTRVKRRRAGEPTMNLIRYADDFVVMVHGTRERRRSALGLAGSSRQGGPVHPPCRQDSEMLRSFATVATGVTRLPLSSRWLANSTARRRNSSG